MAHSQSINEAAPLGTDAASGGAAELRNLKRDIRQRMELEHFWNDALTGYNQDGGHIDFILGICQGRLTLETGVGVSSSDQSAKTTLYFTPFRGNRIALYDGTNWSLFSFAELSITLAGLTASTPYDVFVYSNSGAAALELLAWTNSTTRATALTLQNGVLVKTGVLTRRYVGTIYINSSGGQTDDTFAKRYVWNYYNRVMRPLRVIEGTDTWQYMTATWRQANGAAGNQLDVVVGWAEVMIEVTAIALSTNTGSVNRETGIGEDSTSAPMSNQIHMRALNPPVDAAQFTTATISHYPAVGRHFYTWLERSSASGTTTWYGDGGDTALQQTGIFGRIEG